MQLNIEAFGGGNTLKIYALIGKSGSGKSHRAQQISRDYEIEYIIDDGLLISKSSVIAGVSAKKEGTKVGAIKRAIFSDPLHRQEMIKVIGELQPQSILILGTSDGMVHKIAENLNLPPISCKIYIEDIASQREIDLAIKTRREQGKHVIPVPTFAIKKDFSGYFMDSIKSLTRKGRGADNEDIEKTVIRPTYSYLGKYTIADNVIKNMITYSGERVDGVHRILKVNIENKSNGIKIDLDISIDYGCSIPEVVRRMRESIKNDVEYMTAFNILEINAFVKSFNMNK